MVEGPRLLIVILVLIVELLVELEVVAGCLHCAVRNDIRNKAVAVEVVHCLIA